jgi:acyl-CoA reductase-like NAD-dependent aldehyde dehydrogenase
MTPCGAGILAVDTTSGTVAGFITTTGLTATAAHVHDAACGTPGSVIVPLAGGPNLWVLPDAAAALTTAQLADFAAGSLYFDEHTAANPGGEIRGQIDKP